MILRAGPLEGFSFLQVKKSSPQGGLKRWKKREGLRLAISHGRPLAIVNLDNFVLPVVEKGILNLCFGKTFGEFALALSEDISHSGGDFGHNAHHDIVRGRIQFTGRVGLFNAFVEFSINFSGRFGEFGDVADVVSNLHHGGLLHNQFPFWFFRVSFSFLRIYYSMDSVGCQVVSETFFWRVDVARSHPFPSRNNNSIA